MSKIERNNNDKECNFQDWPPEKNACSALIMSETGYINDAGKDRERVRESESENMKSLSSLSLSLSLFVLTFYFS